MDLERRLLINNMTKVELAEKIGVTSATISRYCKSQRMPKPDILKKIADVFGITVDELLSDTNFAAIKPMDMDSVEKFVELLLKNCKERKDHAKLIYDMALERYNKGYATRDDLIMLMDRKMTLYGHEIPEFINYMLEEIKSNRN